MSQLARSYTFESRKSSRDEPKSPRPFRQTRGLIRPVREMFIWLAEAALSWQCLDAAAKYIGTGFEYCSERDLELYGLYLLAYRARLELRQGRWSAAGHPPKPIRPDPEGARGAGFSERGFAKPGDRRPARAFSPHRRPSRGVHNSQAWGTHPGPDKAGCRSAWPFGPQPPNVTLTAPTELMYPAYELPRSSQTDERFVAVRATDTRR
jgi:hypothetical protein